MRLGRFASSLSTSGCFNLPPFCYPFLGAPRGPDVTKIILSPSGFTVSPVVFTPAVDRSVAMHDLCRKSISQLCCGFGIQLRVNSWILFGMITGRSRFTCLQCLYVSSGFIFCAPSFQDRDHARSLIRVAHSNLLRVQDSD